MHEHNLLGLLNDLLASGSQSFQADAVGLTDFLNNIRDNSYSDDEQLNRQFQTCAAITGFMTWATVHREDFEVLAKWWSDHVARQLLEVHARENHGRD